jgi:hypothetical protein
MNIDRISYKKVFPIGSYLTEHIGLEATLDMGESPEVALQRLQIIVNDLHSATIATLEETRGTQVKDIAQEPKVSNEDKKQMQIQGWVEAINSCSSLKVLEIYTKMVERENVEILYEAYNSTKKRLENEQL